MPDTEETTQLPTVLWRTGSNQDHPHLRSFVCTDQSQPGREPWAEEVESWITDEGNLPGVRQVSEIRFHCGYIAARLAAVGTWRHDEKGPGASWWYFLPAMAIAWPYRGKGGWLADQTLERLLTEIDSDALRRGAAEINVVARVHRENVPAELLFAAAGFMRFAADDAGRHRAWRRRWDGVQGLELS